MPFMIALALGSVAGASVAIINNKELILETAETVFQRGAEFCRNKLEEAKQKNQMHFADNYEDDHFKDYKEKSPINDEQDNYKKTVDDEENHFQDPNENTLINDEFERRRSRSNLNNDSDYGVISTPEMTDFSEIDTDDYDGFDDDDDDEDTNLHQRNHHSSNDRLEIESLD